MVKIISYLLLSSIVSAVLFGLLALPHLADEFNTDPLLSDKHPTSIFQTSSGVSSQLTFTPVMTIYLPVVFSVPISGSLNIVIELPNGNNYRVGENIEVIIMVTSSKGVDRFQWGVFTKNLTTLFSRSQACGGATECRTRESFSLPPVTGEFLIGVEAQDKEGKVLEKSNLITVEEINHGQNKLRNRN